jgi:hypothetical protein
MPFLASNASGRDRFSPTRADGFRQERRVRVRGAHMIAGGRSPYSLDVIIATYNRKEMLQTAIRSVLDLQPPLGMTVRVIVADNNSADGTRDLVKSLSCVLDKRLHYLFEPRQGKSYALNSAIAAAEGDLVAIIDDDEEVQPDWLNRVFDLFQNPTVQYAGGRTLPKSITLLPGWVPTSEFRAVIGWAEGPSETCLYTANDPKVFLMGGNAVFRREFLQAMGPTPYNVKFGRKGGGLLTADDDMYERVLATGAMGVYDPTLIVHHAVQPHMLTKRYYRRWCFWCAVSCGALERTQPSPGSSVLGVPRWKLRRGIESLGRLFLRKCSPDRNQRNRSFVDELHVVQTAGLLYGRFFFRAS